MAQQIAHHRPDWPAVPDELERAWTWMEEQGHGFTAPAGYVLSPYPDHAGSSPAFLAGLSLEGWFDEGSVGHAQLLPIAEAAGDGSQIALWRDDDGQVRVVVLDSEGTGYLIADDARSLVTLLAVGYDEISEMNLGDAPADPIADEALAPLRSWLASEFAIEAPDEWPAAGDDEFSSWLDRQLGRDQPATATAEDRGTTVTGEVLRLLEMLGEPDGPETAARVQELTGATVKDRLRSSTAALKRVGLEISSDRHGIATIWIRTTDRAFGPIVTVAAPAYPRPAALIDGLDDNSTLEEALALLGEPERRNPTALRYVVAGRYLHLSFDDGVFSRITLMVDAT